MIEDLLNKVHRPAQYLGNEWNAAKKDFEAAAVTFALGFADLYEVGMSNLGLRIIYGVLNSVPGVTCERFFAPEPDMEEILRNSHTRLFSLESNRALSDFDCLGFSLGSELNYTNVLNILDLAGLPLLSSERDQTHPLVIGGGPCTLNPEPLADFFDLFVIGEAEEASLELIDLYRELKADFKASKLSRQELLLKLSVIKGVYAPSLYLPDYGTGKELVSFTPKFKELPLKINKRIIGDFNQAYFPDAWMVPHVQTVHDRITLEIMRGCPHRCRFCQARSQYYPLRVRSKEKVSALAEAAYGSSGYEELSLAGLSVGDYPGIEQLVSGLTKSFDCRGVSLSLPSLKAKALLGNVSTLIAKTKKTGLTFAPEAGTHQLRQALAKDFSEEEFFQAIEQAYQAGYQHLKLYFLIGLPAETESDLAGIIDFAKSASEAKRKVNGSPAAINISINPLIPKPHTPFQWKKMDSLESIRQKQNFLKAQCKNRRLKLNFHNLEMAHLEGVLSRGDRRLGKVIEAAFKKGARFDAWSNYFSFPRWLEAFSETGIDPAYYLDEAAEQKLLPWDFIDVGIDKQDLLADFNKSIAR
jgi:radical SAM family uncharacterized protein